MSRPPSALSRPRAARRGLTMVELMITVAIISVLASLVLFAMAAAQESAREARTKALVATLHSLVMEQYDSYRTRRVPVNTSGMSPSAAADKRLHALRELMKIEMPDRYSDISTDPVLIARTALSQAYQSSVAGGATDQYQGAECLYLIVTCANPDARSLFAEANIGDKDNDGMKEFLDGWGNPISYIRWPAGLTSEIQSRNATTDHDPFDNMIRESTAYRLVPLIYSAGADGEYDTHFGQAHTYPVTSNKIDPYAVAGAAQIGTLIDTNSSGTLEYWDNIHNHLIGLK